MEYLSKLKKLKKKKLFFFHRYIFFLFCFETFFKKKFKLFLQIFDQFLVMKHTFNNIKNIKIQWKCYIGFILDNIYLFSLYYYWLIITIIRSYKCSLLLATFVKEGRNLWLAVSNAILIHLFIGNYQACFNLPLPDTRDSIANSIFFINPDWKKY